MDSCKKGITYEDLLKSETAVRMCIDNTPPVELSANIWFTARCLTDIMQIMDVDFTINSGYRCTRLNDIVGGVKNSLHTKGLAADIHPYGKCREILCGAFQDVECRKAFNVAEFIDHVTYIHIGFSDSTFLLKVLRSLWYLRT